MKLSRWQALWGLILAAVLFVPAWGANTDKNSAVPGTLNYVEGQASLNDHAVDSKSIGSAQLDAGQSLTTNTGKAEVLLTPGVYLRLGDHSAVKMVSPSLTRTEVSLDQGRALLEVDQISRDNDIRVDQGGAISRIQKTGLYSFDADQNVTRVFDGKEVVQVGDKNVTVKGSHELALNSEKLKAEHFDKKQYEDSDLYRFSDLRSSYLAEANVNAARLYVADGWYGPGWFGAGWYWDPWFSSYTFIPGGGFFYNPFGWGFYSPLVVYRSPVWYGSGYRHFGATYQPPVRAFSHAPMRATPGMGSQPMRPAPAFRAFPNMSAPHGFSGGGMRGGFPGRG